MLVDHPGFQDRAGGEHSLRVAVTSQADRTCHSELTTGAVVLDPLVVVVHLRNLCVVVANWASDQLRLLEDRPKVDNHLK